MRSWCWSFSFIDERGNDGHLELPFGPLPITDSLTVSTRTSGGYIIDRIIHTSLPIHCLLIIIDTIGARTKTAHLHLLKLRALHSDSGFTSGNFSWDQGRNLFCFFLFVARRTRSRWSIPSPGHILIYATRSMQQTHRRRKWIPFTRRIGQVKVIYYYFFKCMPH